MAESPVRDAPADVSGRITGGPSDSGRAGGAGFPPSARVLRPAEYQHVLRRGRRLAHSEWFQVIQAAPAADAVQPAHARLGLIVGKRNAPLSVTRQALKRVWRETFRQSRLVLPAGDYVVRLQSRVPSMSLTALKKSARGQADSLLRQATRRAGKARQG